MKLPKQRNIPWLGAFVDSLFTSLPILSIINFLSIQTVLYATVVQYVLPWLPWFNFGLFILIMVAITFALMVFVYKFVIPSLWAWRGTQLYGHQSPVMDEIKALHEEIEHLRHELAKDNPA